MYQHLSDLQTTTPKNPTNQPFKQCFVSAAKDRNELYQYCSETLVLIIECNESYISGVFLDEKTILKSSAIFFFFFFLWHWSGLKPKIETVSAADRCPCKPEQQLVKEPAVAPLSQRYAGILCLGGG